MLESWLLLICHPEWQQNDLPLFARKAQTSPQKFYKIKKTPDQLKDLAKSQRRLLDLDQGAFCRHCAGNLNANDLATRSPSFAQFKAQVDQW